MAGDNLARKLPSRGTNRGRSKVPSSYRRAFGGPSNVPMQSPSRQAASGLSTAGQLQQAETAKTPPAGNNKPTSAADVAKKENAADNRMKYNPTKSPSSPSSKRAGVFFRNNKGKLIGGAAAVVMGGGLLTGGIFMSGPLQFLHVAELIGDITDTIHDITRAGRTVRNLSRVYQLSRTAGSTLANSRLGSVSQFWAKSYEKRLAKSGVRIGTDSVGRFTHFEFDPAKINSSADDILKKLPASAKDLGRASDNWIKVGAESWDNFGNSSARTQFFKNAFKAIEELAPNAPRAGPVMTRILGVKNLMVGFHPFHAMTAKRTLSKLEKMTDNITKKLLKKYSKRGIQKTANEIAEEAAETILKRIGKIGFGVFKKIPVVGWVSTIVDFFITLDGKQKLIAAGVSIALGLSMEQAMSLQSMADQIKYGDANGSLREPETASIFNTILSALGVSNANAEEVNYTLSEQLEMAADQNFYREIEVSNYENYENISTGSTPETEEEYNGMIDAVTGIGPGSTAEETQPSSFWQSSLVNAEISGGVPEDDGRKDTPLQLFEIHLGKHNSNAQVIENVINAAIEAVGVGISFDTFDQEEEFNPETLTPRQIGSSTMYGARVTEKEKMRALGGKQLTESGAVAMEKERREIVDREFNEKPWYAKIFDINDYKSAIATLARDSGWNMNEGSIFNQLKNVAQTVIMSPQILARSANRTSQSAIAYNYGLNDWYNIGSMGYSDDDLDKLPEMDEAIAEVEEILNGKETAFKEKVENAFNNMDWSTDFGFGAPKVLPTLVEKITQKESACIIPDSELCLSVVITEEEINKILEECKSDFDLKNRSSCSRHFLSINLVKSGLIIDPDGDVVPIPNDTEDLDTQASDFFENSTYQYQSTNTDTNDPDEHSCNDYNDPNDCHDLTPSVQAYIMDYQIIMSGAALMDDGSTESEEAFSELGNKDAIENDLNIGFTKLVAGVGGNIGSGSSTSPVAEEQPTTQQNQDEFKATVMSILNSSSGWKTAGVTFSEANGNNTVTIQYPASDSQCGKVPGYESIPVSCHVGGVLYFPSSRWNGGSPNWNKTGQTLDNYRHMVLNHEMGHFLDDKDIIADLTDSKGDREGDVSHETTCETNSDGNLTGSGKAPIMMQQTLYFNGCSPNPWPEAKWQYNYCSTHGGCKVKVVFTTGGG